jgi:hypothetical protein
MDQTYMPHYLTSITSFCLNFIDASRYADQSQYVFTLDDYSNCTFVQAREDRRGHATVFPLASCCCPTVRAVAGYTN